jgi:hypothetical protein
MYVVGHPSLNLILFWFATLYPVINKKTRIVPVLASEEHEPLLFAKYPHIPLFIDPQYSVSTIDVS